MDTKKIIDKIVDYMKNIGVGEFKEECPISIIDINKWEWAQGVGLYGLMKYYQATKNEEILDYLVKWYDNNIEKGLPSRNINTTCPMLTLTYVYEYTKNEKYFELCKDWAEWLLNDFEHTSWGTLLHRGTGWEEWDYLHDIALDTLFMSVLFLHRMGLLTGNEAYTNDAINQFLVHIKFLQDKKTGLFYHVWSFDEFHNFSEVLWGRGNCWFTVAVVDFLEKSGEKYEAINYYLKSALLDQAQALKKYQNENGMWHTVINDPTSYVESSGTSGFGYGILKAVRLGYLPEEYREVGEKAVSAIIERVGEDGAVGDCSYGTWISDVEGYKSIPITPMAYGQALAMLLLVESLND